MNKILTVLFCTTFLTACVSNFGERNGMALRKETSETIGNKIIKGKTTSAEMTAMYGRFAINQQDTNAGINRYCTDYHETKLPLYNFLPTNFFYMSSKRTHWKLCYIADDKGIVQDYTFDKDVKRDSTVLSGIIK